MEAGLPLSRSSTNLPDHYSFSFNAPAPCLQPSLSRKSSCISLPPADVPLATCRDIDDEDRLQSDRPTKRVRQPFMPMTEHSIDQPALFMPEWEQHLAQNTFSHDQLQSAWHSWRKATSVRSFSPASGLLSPPQSPPPEIENPTRDLWREVPPGIEPGDCFYMADDFEIEGKDDQVIPLIIGRSDVIGPSYLPVAHGTRDSDKGAFYYDPALAHIQLAISEDVEEVDVFHEVDDKLFYYLGRFAAVQSKTHFLERAQFEQLSLEDQLAHLLTVYDRQPAGRRMSKKFILEKLIGVGRWFPQVVLIPIVHDSEPEVPDARDEEREYFVQREASMVVPLSDIEVAPCQDDTDAHEVAYELSVPPLSPLSTIHFGSDEGDNDHHSLNTSLSRFFSCIPTTCEPITLFDTTSTGRSYSPLPEHIQERPLTRMGFESVDYEGDETTAAGGFPDSPEQTYSSRLSRQSDDNGLDPGYTAPSLPRPGGSFGFYSQEDEEEEENSPRNTDNLASELNLGEEESYLSNSETAGGGDDEGDDDQRFFVREGSNPPETWGLDA